MDKFERQTIIREIITSHNIQSQEDLKQHLLDKGYSVAQATLSRDIKDMGIVKTASGYRIYEISDEAKPKSTLQNRKAKRKPIPTGSVIGLEFGTGLAVMRTTPGHAGMVASIIDAAALPQIMGTIAGDDTILIIIRPKYCATEVYDALGTLVDIHDVVTP